ncbi:MAG: glycogen synthase [Sandaracinaceae bacterium]|nr:glycogen synthase [Sandaracinaceae bacterium]
MLVLFIATEVAPWIKVGGLGDVVGSLPRALRDLGVDARICVPAHAGVLAAAPDPTSIARFEVPGASGPLGASGAEIFETRLGDVPVYLVAGGPIEPDGIVYTGRIDEEGHRFSFFARAALELTRRLERPVDVVHAHDWHAAAIPWLLSRGGPAAPASVFTVHNLPYAGVGAEPAQRAFGIPGSDDPRLPPHLRGAPMALGLLGADAITTVSPTYADEITTPEGGHGFDALLRSRRADLTGILNGLDVDAWDPRADRALAATYSASDRGGRDRCRDALADELGLPRDVPRIGIVSRLVPQKGIDVAIAALRGLRRDFAAVILGAGDPHLEHEARALAADRPDRVRVWVGFDAGLARRIYAGADLLLLPSRYEPCGMTQMIAMRYGCVPVACETGGLADTVRDLDLAEQPTGVLFAEPTPRAAAFGLRRALATRAQKAESWDALVQNGMTTDFSWRGSAREYLTTYERARARRAEVR